MLAFSGHALRAARQSAGLRPEQLACQVERSVYSIHSYEWGRVCPSVPVLCKIAETLGIQVGALFAESPGRGGDADGA